MTLGRLLLALLATLAGTSHGWSLTTNPARPITHQVSIRLIETALANGTSPATSFGNPRERADIESHVDAIWAQAGIDVNFLPTIVRYNDTFAYHGNAVRGASRPVGDLNLILSGADTKRVLHPDDSVINMFLVDVVPGFSAHGESWAGGLANVGANGIAINIGPNLLSSPSGRQSIATLIAHEIGHNLGLQHLTDETDNLMTTKRSSAQISDEQREAIFQWHFRSDDIAYLPQGGTGFPQPIAEPLSGDFTHNGIVDAADFTLWRDTLASSSHLGADANGDSIVNQLDYDDWKNSFGQSILPAELPGDFNLDGTVNTADYALWRDTLGSRTNLAADGDRNQIVDQGDYQLWRANFSLSLLPRHIPGDYSRDGTIDSSDFVVWRDTLGSTTNLAADGNGNRVIDAGDYLIWKNGFGAPSAVGAVFPLGSAVPEPASIVMFSIATFLCAARRRRRKN